MNFAPVLALVALVVLAHVGFAEDIPTPIAGVTNATYNGSLVVCHNQQNCNHNGYSAAHDACDKEYKGSHVCNSHEIGVVAQGSESLGFIFGHSNARFIDMSFADVEGHRDDVDYALNDCRGFTNSQEGNLSKCITEVIGGPLLPTVCSCTDYIAFVCCN